MARHPTPALALAALAALAALLGGGGALAGPSDAKVGETRAVYKKDGTPLRAEPASLSNRSPPCPRTPGSSSRR